MLFRDCQKGYPVYILDRNEITTVQGKVVEVTRPHFDSSNPSSTQMVVDVYVEVDGKRQAPMVIPDSAPVAYTDRLVIATEKDTIMREVQAIMDRNQEELGMVEQRKKVVERCKTVIEDWNPDIKERRKTDERIGQLEKSLDEVRESMGKSDTKMDQILKLLQGRVN